jgi:hypothetical protein
MGYMFGVGLPRHPRTEKLRRIACSVHSHLRGIVVNQSM